MSTSVMEYATNSNPNENLSRLAREGEAWTSLIVDTLLQVVTDSADGGGITYDDAISEARRKLTDVYTHLTHDWQLFDEILNQLSIDRKIDSHAGNRLFIYQGSDWRNSLGGTAINSSRATTI
ncbi:hypothetical protein [Rhodococcus sp. NPDC060176]|uniref:hypothetical protein n=1 Tax=Rhodococcus sp. NPDC060176 TaxID=3347062 RepID=UPI003654D66E